MKKIISLLLVLMMLTVMTVGCAGNNQETVAGTTETKAEVPASALEILQNIWSKYADDEKFSVMGGDAANMVMDGPGNYSLTDVETLGIQLLVPADQVKNITQAAALFHGMMVNNFTCGVFRVAQGVDAAAFAETMHDAVKNARWICGMPEKAMIAVIGGEYVLMAFGLNDTINRFEAKLTAAYPDAQIKYSEAITR